MLINVSDGMHVISWKDILYCEAMSNYCTICLVDGTKIVLSRTLGTLALALPKREFFRVHQSHLVNLNCIRFADAHDVRLDNGHHIPIARSRRKALMQRISEISFSL
jgi:two-component system LytT family response regulator